jgi:hypothetical protein
MSSTSSAREGLDRVPGPPAATENVVDGPHAAACQTLESTVTAYLRDGWRIADRRCYLLRAGTPWNSMEKFVGNELGAHGASRVSFDWHEPGIDRIAVWKLGRFDATHVAVAMAREPIDGQPLVGYFEVRRN